MKTIKVLAIGNSFSQDATRYLYDIAKAAGVKMKVVNLYIGGCSLWRHYKNINNDAKAYEMEFNGMPTNFMVSVKEALQSDIWDYVTMQQVSHNSQDYETYQPYLNALSEYVKLHAPKAKQLIHQTWAYEEESYRLTKELGYETAMQMHEDVCSAYKKAAKEIKADIIPSGEAMMEMIKNGVSMHRDTFHAKFGIGRYTLGAVWFEKLTGINVIANSFSELDEDVSEDEILLAQKIAHEVVEKNK